MGASILEGQKTDRYWSITYNQDATDSSLLLSKKLIFLTKTLTHICAYLHWINVVSQTCWETSSKQFFTWASQFPLSSDEHQVVLHWFTYYTIENSNHFMARVKTTWCLNDTLSYTILSQGVCHFVQSSAGELAAAPSGEPWRNSLQVEAKVVVGSDFSR